MISKARAFCLLSYPFRVCFYFLYGASRISHPYLCLICVCSLWQSPLRTKQELPHFYRSYSMNSGPYSAFVNFTACIIISLPLSLPLSHSLILSLSVSLHFSPFLSLAEVLVAATTANLANPEGQRSKQPGTCINASGL